MANLTASVQALFPQGVPATPPGGCIGMLLPMQPDSTPGPNTLTITGLAGVKTISVWITELYSGQQPGVYIPHAGGATFQTLSVQLDGINQLCRVLYTQNFNTPLLSGAQVILGY
jgi:hypothetical protein